MSSKQPLHICPCLCRHIPAVVISKAADPSSAAALCSDVAGGSAERDSRLWKAGWVCDAGDGDSSRPAQSKAARPTASSTESESMSVNFTRDQVAKMLVMALMSHVMESVKSLSPLSTIFSSDYSRVVQKWGNSQLFECSTSSVSNPPTRIHRSKWLQSFYDHLLLCFSYFKTRDNTSDWL